MKILLFGEFSGLYNSLKEGLVAEGHHVFLASNGDGTKNYPSDFRWDIKMRAPLKVRLCLEVLNIFLHKNKLKGYDAVLLMSPLLFGPYLFLNRLVYNFLIKNNKKVFLSGTGLTPYSLTFWYNTDKKYHHYAKGLLDNPSYRKYYFNNKILMEWEMSLHDRVNGYIPIWYEYAEPFRNHPKTLKTIRIPINAAKFEYTPNIVKDKIVFFHGRPSRPGAKGTAYIEEAFKRMKNRYGDIAEFHVAGGLPFKEYMSLVARTNVILDDTNSYSIAMNGLFSLAQGKIVLGGAEREGNEELGLMDNPVINIVPDVNQICEAIEFLIKNKDTFVELGKKGREFVERNHDFKEIARLYVNTIENN
jgi:glycosyltransferase involved in cell wall biosynthesis